MSQTNVLITGGNRGLGLALVTRFLAQPNHTVISANRDPNHPTSKALSDLPKGKGSKLIVVKYDATVESDATAIVDQLQQEDGINIAHLDIVVANAGIAKYYPFVKDVKRAQIQEHLDVNVFGVVALYQATRELLSKSPRAGEGDEKKKPVFVPVGSSAGSLGRQLDIPNAAYGPTKTMLNWYGVRINAEDDWLNAFVLDPGFVQTEMGNEAASFFGMGKATLTVDESADGMFRVINTGTKEEFGGRLVFYTGEVLAW